MSDKSKSERFSEACDAWADWRENNRGGCSPDECVEENKAWSRLYGYFEDAEKANERLRAENAELKSYVKWFEARRDFALQAIDVCTTFKTLTQLMDRWDAENPKPKPGSNTCPPNPPSNPSSAPPI